MTTLAPPARFVQMTTDAYPSPAADAIIRYAEMVKHNGTAANVLAALADDPFEILYEIDEHYPINFVEAEEHENDDAYSAWIDALSDQMRARLADLLKEAT